MIVCLRAENYDEELLALHENALEAVKNFYAENEYLLKKIEKRFDCNHLFRYVVCLLDTAG